MEGRAPLVKMDVHKFLILAGSKILVVDEGGRRVEFVVHQDFEAQATETVQIRASEPDSLDEPSS